MAREPWGPERCLSGLVRHRPPGAGGRLLGGALVFAKAVSWHQTWEKTLHFDARGTRGAALCSRELTAANGVSPGNQARSGNLHVMLPGVSSFRGGRPHRHASSLRSLAGLFR